MRQYLNRFARQPGKEWRVFKYLVIVSLQSLFHLVQSPIKVLLRISFSTAVQNEFKDLVFLSFIAILLVTLAINIA